MSDSRKWTRWNIARPSEPGLYWWRVGPADRDGMVWEPEFVAELWSVGMGYKEHELWPSFSHWNGYQRTVPSLTEWSPCDGSEKKGDFVHGIDLLPCPFCGGQPLLKWVHGDRNGVFIGSHVYQANEFWIVCGGCGVDSRHGGLKFVTEFWNRRLPSAGENLKPKE